MVLRTSIIGEEIHKYASLISWVKSQENGAVNGFINHLWNGITTNQYGKICMQILHSGRYGYHPLAVSASNIKSPIAMFKPKALSERGIQKTINDYARCAALAKYAGYDGVEIMGSEGYLINQFIVKRTNRRSDGWGGSYENRIKFPLEIVKRTREKVGSDFIIIFRLVQRQQHCETR